MSVNMCVCIVNCLFSRTYPQKCQKLNLLLIYILFGWNFLWNSFLMSDRYHFWTFLKYKHHQKWQLMHVRVCISFIRPSSTNSVQQIILKPGLEKYSHILCVWGCMRARDTPFPKLLKLHKFLKALKGQG